MTIEELNKLETKLLKDWFMQTCTAQSWCQLMVDGRPYDSLTALKSAAQNHWQSMQNDDFLEAFKGHPMIGDVNSLRKKYANTKALASNEQSGVKAASEKVLLELSKRNKEYYEKHGFIFIICATGLSAEHMLNELEKRLVNDTQTEINNAAKEQLKITLLRIDKALN